MLSEKEIQVRDYLMTKIVPTLEQFLKEKNPTEFAKWHGNCCKQTAYLVCYVLKKELPEYIWQIKEFLFKWEKSGQLYNHAFVVGKSKKNGKLLVDLARHPIWNDLFIKVDSIKKPYANTEIKDEVIEEAELTYNEMHEIYEYYTRIKGKDLIKEVLKRIENNSPK